MTWAVLVALMVYPFCGEAARLRLKSGASQGILDALGIELDVDLSHAVPGALIVAMFDSGVGVP